MVSGETAECFRSCREEICLGDVSYVRAAGSPCFAWKFLYISWKCEAECNSAPMRYKNPPMQINQAPALLPLQLSGNMTSPSCKCIDEQLQQVHSKELGIIEIVLRSDFRHSTQATSHPSSESQRYHPWFRNQRNSLGHAS